MFGVFYGFSHQQAISSRDRAAEVKAEYERKQKLIDQAKAKFAEKTQPKTGDGSKSCPRNHMAVKRRLGKRLRALPRKEAHA